MRIASLAGLAAASFLAVVVSAAQAPSLEQAYSSLSQSLKPQAAALKESAKAHEQKAQAALPARRVREFHLEFNRGWHLRPDPTPPGGGLKIDVDAGDHVRLDLINENWRGDAQFLVD